MAGTRTYNVIKKLSDSFDALLEKLKKCVYTDSKAQLRSLTLAEPDGTVHDSPIGTVIHGTKTGVTALDKTTWGDPIASITLTPGTWAMMYQVRTILYGSASDCAIAANISTSKKKDYLQSIGHRSASSGLRCNAVNRTDVFSLTSTTTYYLNARAYDAGQTIDSDLTYVNAVRIA